jgi:hypothetical protein
MRRQVTPLTWRAARGRARVTPFPCARPLAYYLLRPLIPNRACDFVTIRYLCTHRPVVWPEGQLAPLGAPVEQTIETKVSSSPQETCRSPTTTRIAGPADPCGPTSPLGPGGPGGPTAPCGPGGPGFCSQPTKARLTAIRTARYFMQFPPLFAYWPWCFSSRRAVRRRMLRDVARERRSDRPARR